MLSGKELVRRANMKRPDPVRDPKRYRQWYYARLVVGRREDARKNLFSGGASAPTHNPNFQAGGTL